MTDKTVLPVAAATVAPDNTAILAAAASQATTAERARISAILTCEEARDRGDLPNHLAMNTDLSVDAAKAILKAAPVKTAPVAAADPKTAFATAMAKDNPNVSAGADAPAEVDPVTRILENFAQASGSKVKAA